MNSKLRLLFLILASTGLWTAIVQAEPKPLLVHYRPWFVAKPYSDHWGWHWTLNHYNPDYVDASGQRQIASWYRPLIGPYDSADPVVLEYHVLLMKLAGVDGVIVDWHGPDNFLDYPVNNERTRALFQCVRRAGLKFALCYEDQAIQQQIAQGFLAASNAVASAQRTLLYAQTNFFNDPAYLRLDGRPVLLNFGPQYFKEGAQWESILAIFAPTNQPALFTEDNRLAIGVGAFSWPPMWLSVAPGTRGVLSVTALQDYLRGFEAKGAIWPAFISSAFPRFHDIYQSAGVRDYWGYLKDSQGQTFRLTLANALTNRSAIVQIVTWNDFAEGTMVEPTVEYGFRDLALVQECRRTYLDRNFAPGTNDLAMALTQYQLRRSAMTNAALTPKLDRTAASILAGRLDEARQSLDACKASLEKR
jgi:hypothetical protein